MTIAPPPAPLTEGLHLAGKIIGLGKTASWIYPFVILRVDWTCVKYSYSDLITGQTKETLSVPYEGSDADYFWPAWDAKVDYSSPTTAPYCPWRVSYNDLYYETTFWLSATQLGRPPSEAMANVGDLVNIHQDYGQSSFLGNKKTRCKNQSHPVRAWKCIGSLLENNQWRNDFWYYDYDPISGERKHSFMPVFLNQVVDDPSKAGGDGPRGYYEAYYPSMEEPRELEPDPEFSTDTPFAKTVRYKQFTGTKDKIEPITWNPYTGDMPTRDIACGNQYLQFGIGGRLTGFIHTGISANLWYSKLTTKNELKKTVHPPENPTSGVTLTYKGYYIQSLSPEKAAESKTHIVDTYPGSGLGFYVSDSGQGQGYGYLWAEILGAIIGQPSYQQGPTWSYSSYKQGIYARTTHPLVWTRALTGIMEERTTTTTYRKIPLENPLQLSPPPYALGLVDVDYSVTYSKGQLKMGENQIAVTMPDKNGKYIYDNQSNQLGTVSLYDYYSDTETVKITKVRQVYGYTEWADD